MLQRVEEAGLGIAACPLPARDGGAGRLVELPVDLGVEAETGQPALHLAALSPVESDLIFGVEEASFQDGRWIATGILSGGLNLRVALPGGIAVHKGKLLPLRFDPSRFVLLRGTPFAASL